VSAKQSRTLAVATTRTEPSHTRGHAGRRSSADAYLQLRVLSLCLAIRPWFDQCRLHRAVVLRNAGSERSHQTLLRISRSFVKPFKLLMFDETMEAAEHISRRRQICIAAPIIAIVRAIAFETGAVPDGMRPVAPGTTMCSVHLSQSALQHGVSRLRPHRSRTGRQF